MKKRNYAAVFAVLAVCLFCMAACGKKKQEGSNCYQIYYVNKEVTRVVSEEYYTDTDFGDMDKLVKELLGKAADTAEKPEYISPLLSSFQNYSFHEGQINLDFHEGYRSVDAISEILGRAAIVRTLTQVDGIDTVSFSVMGDALVDVMGIPVGAMAADSFIDNAGTEINAYAETEFHLYFANETGNGLVEVTRNVIYNSNISMEKQVMEELIRGPVMEENGRKEKGYPTINPAASVLSVTSKDGICYVNLSKEFLVQVYNVTPEITLYSIANSLAELPDVNKVQLAVEGETNIAFSDGINLTTVWERNLDVIDE